jgi:hypothetical protein
MNCPLRGYDASLDAFAPVRFDDVADIMVNANRGVM